MIRAGGSGSPAETNMRQIIMDPMKDSTVAKTTKKAPTPPKAPKVTNGKGDEVKVTTRKAANANCPPSMADIKYTIKGGAPYNPRVLHTQEAWDKMQKVFGIKGVATHKQLCDALATHFTRPEENHHDFIGYMVRRKAISIVK